MRSAPACPLGVPADDHSESAEEKRKQVAGVLKMVLACHWLRFTLPPADPYKEPLREFERDYRARYRKATGRRIRILSFDAIEALSEDFEATEHRAYAFGRLEGFPGYMDRAMAAAFQQMAAENPPAAPLWLNSLAVRSRAQSNIAGSEGGLPRIGEDLGQPAQQVRELMEKYNVAHSGTRRDRRTARTLLRILRALAEVPGFREGASDWGIWSEVARRAGVSRATVSVYQRRYGLQLLREQGMSSLLVLGKTDGMLGPDGRRQIVGETAEEVRRGETGPEGEK
jgi:hypothetical protein